MTLTEAVTWLAFGEPKNADVLTRLENHRFQAETDTFRELARARHAALDGGLRLQNRLLEAVLPEVTEFNEFIERRDAEHVARPLAIRGAINSLLLAGADDLINFQGVEAGASKSEALSSADLLRARWFDWLPLDSLLVGEVEWEHITLGRQGLEDWKKEPAAEEASSDKAAKQRGRPPGFPWEQLRTYSDGLLELHGEPSPDDPELPSQEALVNLALAKCEKLCGRMPDPSTMRGYVAKWILDFRTRRLAISRK